MAKTKPKTRKRPLPPLAIKDDRPRRLLIRLIKTSRDLNTEDVQVLTDLIAKLKA